MIVMPPATKSSNCAVLKAKAPHSLSAIAKFLEDLVKKGSCENSNLCASKSARNG